MGISQTLKYTHSNMRNNKIFTCKPVLSGHTKIDKTNILMANSSLMKV